MAERDETAVAIESQPVNSEDDEPLVNPKLVTHKLHESNPSVSLLGLYSFVFTAQFAHKRAHSTVLSRCLLIIMAVITFIACLYTCGRSINYYYYFSYTCSAS